MLDKYNLLFGPVPWNTRLATTRDSIEICYFGHWCRYFDSNIVVSVVLYINSAGDIFDVAAVRVVRATGSVRA
jgi:hypothetical protein